MEPGANPVFYREEYLVKDDEDYPNKEDMTSWEREYYQFVDKDYAILKAVVDNWDRISYQENPKGKCFWSFKNDKRTMTKFQSTMGGEELNNLIYFLESVNRIKERIKAIKRAAGKEE
jgi:hypothetical protein